VHNCIEASNDNGSEAPRPAPRLEALATPESGAKVYTQTVLPTRCLPISVRRDVDEYWYVLHGEIDVWVAGRHARLRAGMSVALPRNVAHRSGKYPTDCGERIGSSLIGGAAPASLSGLPANENLMFGA
jgi:hypothetical protein